MQTEFRNKDFITLEDWSRGEIDTLLEVSKDLKQKFAMDADTPYLKNKTAFLMFFEESTRTRNSMEAGLAQLGGHANFLDTSTMQVSHGEEAKDTAIVLSSFGHGLACRNCDWDIGNDYLTTLAEYSRVPVMNLQCDLYHPMQALADLLTIEEKKNNLENLKVSVIWAYATTHKKPISVPVSQVQLFPKYGMDVTLAYPEGFKLPDWVIERAEASAKKNNGSLTITHDMEQAYEDADVVIPKNWGNWVTDPHDEEGSDLLEANQDWKCTEEMMNMADDDVIYMHALPADRGNEVEDSVIDGEHSVVFDEAENRLHTAKAVMTLTMGGRG
ncbi:ornithine carbamoyltransferase [Halarsenatibacter silvermanii]|uniref:Ornithine carbamoyltransferase n=1 Tax=Halarsenatibacter silvermanii TaxID=321763 RepID=A0A1G9IC97_9FIRM|nr:ornithine carbamoyltransferase [Halarsenatibacter silvermanii]SDL22453.1 ornithine carbamoyltransferase [Halarsenatibacter silvermanii]